MKKTVRNIGLFFLTMILAACANIASTPTRAGDSTAGAQKLHSNRTATAATGLPTKVASGAQLMPASLHSLPLGLLLREMTVEERENHILDYGVVVLVAVGVSAIAGVREDDLILRVNQVQVKAVDQFWMLMDAENWQAALIIRRGNKQLVINIGDLDRHSEGGAIGSAVR